MGVAVLDTFGDGLAVSHLRFAYFDIHLMSTLQYIDLDIEMQLTHALDNGLAAVAVGFHMKRRVFLHHFVERNPKLLGACLVLGRNRD